jgi:DNA-binding transcriptional regulator PaaX
MVRVEETARRRRKKENIQAAILGSFVAGGTIALSVLAPNAVQLLKFTKLDSIGKQKIDNSFKQLLKKGHLKLEVTNGRRLVRLTQAGERALALQLEDANLKVSGRQKWDGQWRVVIFDIPESRRVVRAKFRRLMKRVGFKQLQGSVWVFPYDCEELLTLIKSELKVGKDILYMVVSALEYDQLLRKHFNLKPR